MIPSILFLKTLMNEVSLQGRVVAAAGVTLCSITNFLETLSKYPSHILRKRSRISGSTNSSPSSKLWITPDVSPLATESDSVPGSEVADTCLLEAGGTIPRYGRLYDFKNVVSRGNEDRVGSLESC